MVSRSHRIIPSQKRTAEENCKAEEARLRAKTIELELLRESKAPSSAGAHFTHPSDPQLPGVRPNVTCKDHLTASVFLF